jgi:dephospho-CoA kinase
VWLVTADEATRKARIMARDGLTEPQAAARLQSRPSEDALRPYAHTILYNDGDEAALTRAVHKSLEGLDLCEKK